VSTYIRTIQKWILYTLSVGLILIQCDLSHKNLDKLDYENESILNTLIEVDTLIEKDYVIIRQPSYDFNIRKHNDHTYLGFNGRLFKIEFTDYFDLSDTVFINRQLEYKQDDIWNKYLKLDFNIIEHDSIINKNFNWSDILNKYDKGFQIISIPVYSEKLNRCIISIDKICGYNDCGTLDIVILEKQQSKWVIKKVIER